MRPLPPQRTSDDDTGQDADRGAGNDTRSRAVNIDTVAILLTAVVLAAVGQLMLKAGMNRMSPDLSLSDFVPLVSHVFTSWQVMLGLVSFSVSGVLWLVTLSRLPLSTAYPVVSLSYVLILLFSTIALGERPGPLVWGGALLIMVGISFIGLGQR